MTKHTTRRRALPLLAATVLITFSGISGAQQQPATGGEMSSSAATPGTITGLTEPSQTVKLGFDIRGVVASVDVKRNDKVTVGQSLMSLDDSEEKATLEYYKRRADTTLQIAEAEETFRVKTIDYNKKKFLFENKDARGAASEFEVQTAEAEMNIAKIKVDEAKHDASVGQAQADSQAARVERMHKVSPIAGEIRDVIVKPGEQVDETKPVMEIVVLDPLYVEVTLVDTNVVQRLKLGDKVQVKYADEPKWREAAVESIDPSADRRSGKHPFRLTLPNPENRKAGLRLEIKLPDAVAAAN